MIRSCGEEDLEHGSSAGLTLGVTGDHRQVDEPDAAGLGRPRGGRGTPSLLVSAFVDQQDLQVFRTVVFIGGLTEEEQLVVVLPLGHVGLV